MVLLEATVIRGLAAIAAIVGATGAALAYGLFAGVVVRSPVIYAIWAASVAVVALAVLWARRHPFRSLFVALVAGPAGLVLLAIGHRFLEWGA